jgi:alternative ribosome-rescue factor
MSHDHQRGDIKHSAVGALVTSPLFRSKTESPKKGKGSYKRQKCFTTDNS